MKYQIRVAVIVHDGKPVCEYRTFNMDTDDLEAARTEIIERYVRECEEDGVEYSTENLQVDLRYKTID